MKKSTLSLIFAGLVAAAFVGCSSSKPEDTAALEPMGEQTVAENRVDTDTLDLGASSAGRAH